MSHPPTIACFLADADHPVAADSDLWRQPLPADRHGVPCGDLRYGDYFTAVTKFLRRDHARPLCTAAAAVLGRSVRQEEIGPATIFLEKHGACYHPSRIRVDCGGETLSLVVNAGVSDAGRVMIQREFGCLEHLARGAGRGITPAVYAQARIDLGGGQDLPLFLGEWFEGFCEFHLSRDPTDGRIRLKVWDPANGPVFLDEVQARRIYREAGRILTTLFDPQRCAQVLRWHHAAGDFVVRLDADGRPALRLITVRDHAPMIPAAENDARAVVEGLVLFAVDTTLRMGVDRIDGVAETVWAGEAAPAAALEGVFRALSFSERSGNLPPGFAPGFFRYLADYPRADLQLMVARLLEPLVRQGAAPAWAQRRRRHHAPGLKQWAAGILDSGESR